MACYFHSIHSLVEASYCCECLVRHRGLGDHRGLDPVGVALLSACSDEGSIGRLLSGGSASRDMYGDSIDVSVLWLAGSRCKCEVRGLSSNP